MNGLDVYERQDLEECETIIAAGLASFVEVGEALATVRDSRLYRAEHATFEDYCRERWGLTHRHVNRLVEASEVVGALGPIGPTPANEGQARELAPLRDDPEAMADAWQQANTAAEAEGVPVAARHVRDAVRGPQPPTGVDPDTGEIAADAPARESVEHGVDAPGPDPAPGPGATTYRRTESVTTTDPQPADPWRPPTPELDPEERRRRDLEASRRDLYTGIARAVQTVAGYGRYSDISKLWAEYDPAYLDPPQLADDLTPERLADARRLIDWLTEWTKENP